MSLYSFITIAELQKKIAAREITPQEVLEFYIRRFEVFDQSIDSALEVFDKESIMQKSGNSGSLLGIPGLLKDNICQQGRTLTCGSKILEHFVSPYDATVTSRLKAEGALMIGRGNMDEFAMGSSTETSAFKKTKNPWNTECVPGGSSGGSAAAVAAGLVPWALGSETGGSVRHPAALCGIVGLKPTYGLISRYGLVAYASSTDQVGILTTTVRDNAIILSAIAGKDEHDASTIQQEKKDYTALLGKPLKSGIRIGIVENALNAEGVDSEVVAAIEKAISVIEKNGAQITRIKVPTLDYAAATYFIVSRAEAASNLARFDGVRYGLRNKSATTLSDMYCNTRHDGFGQEVRARILIGNYVLSAGHAAQFYNNAQKVREMMKRDFDKLFGEVDLLIMPTHPAPAFKIGAFDDNKLQMDLQDYFTCAMNLVGIPALSLPCGMSSTNLPIGFQIVGSHLSEELIFQVAHTYEQVTEWHTKHPEGF